MKTLIIQILIIGTCFIFMNCEKEVPVPDNLKSLPQLVLYANLEAGENNISFTLSNSKPIFNSNASNNNIIEVTQVIITSNDTSQLYTNVNNIQNSYYASTYSITLNDYLLAGNTYKFEVYTSKNEIISGETTIPNSTISSASLFLNPQTNNNSPSYQLSFNGQPNQYYLTGYKDNNSYSEIRFSDQPTSDINIEGQKTISPKADFYIYSSWGGTPSMDYVDFYIKTLDIHNYKLLLSLHDYTGNNPFSEPQNIYSNVTGGLGCVTSSALSKVTLTK